MARVALDEVVNVVSRAFERAGLRADKARICARIHAESSRDGVYSHGLNRVARFVDYLERGWVVADAEPAQVRAIGPIEVWDGGRGPGILNALAATDRAIDLAAAHGVGIVALRNTTHWMRGGAFGWRAAEAGRIAIAWTNTEACMPAWGGVDCRLGNNPFVIAVPRDEGPVVLDMAMSQYSYGKLQVTRLKGERLPFPGGFDSDGVLTDDPGAIEQSMRILPMGFWKGSGLAIMLDLVAAILSEGLATYGIDEVQRGSCTGCSQVFIVLDPDRLGSAAHMREVVDGVVAHVNASAPVKSGRKVTVPGQNTLATREDHVANGVVVDDEIWAEVRRLADG